MKNSLLFCGLMLLLSLSACKVQEEIHFNKDLSGSLSYKLDLSAMRMMAAQMQEMRPDKDDSTNTSQPPADMGARSMRWIPFKVASLRCPLRRYKACRT